MDYKGLAELAEGVDMSRQSYAGPKDSSRAQESRLAQLNEIERKEALTEIGLGLSALGLALESQPENKRFIVIDKSFKYSASDGRQEQKGLLYADLTLPIHNTHRAYEFMTSIYLSAESGGGDRQPLRVIWEETLPPIPTDQEIVDSRETLVMIIASALDPRCNEELSSRVRDRLQNTSIYREALNADISKEYANNRSSMVAV